MAQNHKITICLNGLLQISDVTLCPYTLEPGDEQKIRKFGKNHKGATLLSWTNRSRAEQNTVVIINSWECG